MLYWTREGFQRLVEHVSEGRSVDSGKLADLLLLAQPKREAQREQTFEEENLPITRDHYDKLTTPELDVLRHCCLLLKAMAEQDIRRLMN